MVIDFTSVEFWLVVVGFLVAFVLAFGIGANDVANTFGTSVGSKVLTMRQACILATIFETLGSILIGAKVSGTIRKGILDPSVFGDNQLELMLGYISALIGCCIWLFIATFLSLPISGTHSIVGSTLGMALVSKGFGVIQWFMIAKIVASWFISPLVSGIISACLFVLVKKFVLTADRPLAAGIAILPMIYTVTIFINFGGVLQSSPPLIGLNLIPWWVKLIALAVICVVVYLVVWLILAPFLKKKYGSANNMVAPIKEVTTQSTFVTIPSVTDVGEYSKKGGINAANIDIEGLPDTNDAKISSDTASNSKILQQNNDKDVSRSDPEETTQLFSFLQILTAIFGSFAHGGNDVSNAIGPLIGLYLIWKDGAVVSQSSTPEWILLYGGVGISVGLWVLGRRVIKTIGEDLTKITPSSGFVIELASAMTVLGASLMNIPISSTHCKVGSVVFTGRVRAKDSVDWSLFRNIGLAWILTVPITCGIAALCQVILKLSFGLPL